VARKASRHVHGIYRDAALFINLRAHSAGQEPVQPADALDTLLRALGVASESVPDGVDGRAALWRAELAGRRAVVVLDNAASAAQVRSLLPGAAGCVALITSRHRLTDPRPLSTCYPPAKPLHCSGGSAARNGA